MTAAALVSANQKFRRNTAVETAPLQQDSILYHPTNNRFCILNRTSSFIWNQLQTPASAMQIASDLAANFGGVTTEDALKDVQQALTNLMELDLVTALETD